MSCKVSYQVLPTVSPSVREYPSLKEASDFAVVLLRLNIECDIENEVGQKFHCTKDSQLWTKVG